jgi:hypothetical protein
MGADDGALRCRNYVIKSRVEGFAYESEAGKPIRAGETGPATNTSVEKPATLGVLAAGAAGLAAWRKQP